MNKLKLGDHVKDRITGFGGIAIARTDWLYGCTRYGVQSEELDKDGTPVEVQWFDEQSLCKRSKRPGGPCPGTKETG
jgi:hypothetical protein